MFEENSSLQDQQNSFVSGSNNSTLYKSQENKKTKAISKVKSKQSKIDNGQSMIENISGKGPLTKQQKKQIQKQKNRVAAQLSRDRQKKYVEDLQIKIQGLQKQLEQKVCSRCKAILSDHSTYEDQAEAEDQQSLMRLVNEPQKNDTGFLNQVPEVEQLPLVRDNSRNDVQWGNIGKYFCMVLFIVGIALLSTSVQGDQNGVSSSAFGHQVARVLTQNQQVCLTNYPKHEKTHNISNHSHKNIPISSPISVLTPSAPASSTIEHFNSHNIPFIQGLTEPIQKCKNHFWNNYLDHVRTAQNSLSNNNLVNCNNPHLIHISTLLQNNSLKPVQVQDKWTFLITNPTVTHSHMESTGQYYVDQVSYLNGVYQMIAEKVVLKKVMGKNCLA